MRHRTERPLEVDDERHGGRPFFNGIRPVWQVLRSCVAAPIESEVLY